jgi:hypothetical protein
VENRSIEVEIRETRRARKQRSDVGKFSFVNRTIADWNQLPEEIFGFPPAKVHAFSKRVRKAVDRL